MLVDVVTNGARGDGTRSGDARVAALRERVAFHVPADERERHSCQRLLLELAALPAPFDRDASSTHVTASAVVVGRRGVLLHRHRRLGRWMQPGGHVEPGEHPWEAARRETEEETGIRTRHPSAGPRLVQVDVHDASLGHVHLDLRYLMYPVPSARAGDDDLRPQEGESREIAWCPWGVAVDRVDAPLAALLRRLEPGRTARPRQAFAEAPDQGYAR